MKNKRVILIDGFARGGTNILWNIIQSHPNVCSPILETGELIGQHFSPMNKRVIRAGCRLSLSSIPFIRALGFQLDDILYAQKLKNLENIDHSWKTPKEKYTREEIEESVLCLKSINNDIYLTPLLFKQYDHIHGFGLIRNGLAVCEGWVRRGLDASQFGKIYKRYSEKLIEYEKKYDSYALLKFENMVRDPFAFAEHVYRSCELSPHTLDMLRLKSKKVLDKNGSHQVSFGEENKKKWFGVEEIQQVVNPNIDEIQIAKLSEGDREKFLLQARPVLEHFGYL